ncbi:uncharacterized protein EV154DRAFT_587311 [Mucor mucedo]|uniref:uncharacterized protein n=1 Tax=Mucor mucedo TaxID=29922 RepID=UPI00221EBE12|nr:uncharacterized protein EV154DRAFT_587311 [Mucor mucedo]KAI7891994.1 hypothetical protein EV154DRAFT_587311 [Mucor mucedo]
MKVTDHVQSYWSAGLLARIPTFPFNTTDGVKHLIADYYPKGSLDTDTDSDVDEEYEFDEYQDNPIVDSDFDDEDESIEIFRTLHRQMSYSLDNPTSDVEADVSSFTQSTIWNSYVSVTHPFANIQAMILHALVDGDNDIISRRKLKTILFFISLLMKVKEKADNEGVTFQQHVIDRLEQGEKWRSHEYFQQPMWTVHSIDYWNGDWVRLSNTLPDMNYLVKSFHSCNRDMYVRGYLTYQAHNSNQIGIELKESDVLVHSLMCKIDYLNPDICFSISPIEVPPLTDSHAALLRGSHRWRKLGDQRTEEYYKVKIAPIILFTDDISGNISKQFNDYESWSMKFVGLNFDQRSSIKNVHFISAISKKKWAYSAEEEQDVLVVAHILWNEVDTPCHSELCE